MYLEEETKAANQLLVPTFAQKIDLLDEDY
jgi:hypothetical protein